MLGDDAEVDGLDVVGALGDDDDVGSRLSRQGFSQAACGEHLVFVYEAVDVGEEYGGGGGDVAVLEGVVEEYEVCFGEVFPDLAYSSPAVGIDGDGDVGKLPLDLQWLVSYLGGCGCGLGYDEASAFALVPSAQEGYVVMGGEQVYEVLGVWGLACASDGDVADGYDGYVVCLGGEYLPVEEAVPQLYDGFVYEGKGPEAVMEVRGVVLVHILCWSGLCCCTGIIFFQSMCPISARACTGSRCCICLSMSRGR